MATSTTDLGQVVLMPKGEWSGLTSYSFLDLVSAGGNSYISKVPDNLNHAVTDTAFWQIAAEKGGAGGQGEPGSPGETGAEGRGIESSSYNPATGILTITYTDETTYETSDLRGTLIDFVASASTDTITLDCDNFYQYDTTDGPSDKVLAFSNLKTVNGQSLLIVYNYYYSGTKNIVLPTGTITSEGITYKFISLINSPVAVTAGGSVELDFLFVFTSANYCEIRITGASSL